MTDETYMKKRKKFSGFFFTKALPNEYLVAVGKKDTKPITGGKKFSLFQKYIRIPAYVQKLQFVTDNANVDYQGIGIEGYASWRINPDAPEVSIAVLDFFDEYDPMGKTNEALKTICIEAVRHVIANMTIEQALKNKDDIADNLKNQLKEVETKWGIVFDQVGIEKVTIMSNNVFKDLQADFRNRIRQDSETKRISTDRNIAKEDNAAKEKTRLEEIETEQKVGMVSIDNKTKIRHREIDENKKIEDKERHVREENFRKEQVFNIEKEQKNNEISILQRELAIKLQVEEKKLLESRLQTETVKNKISEKEIAVQKLRRELAQVYSNEELSSIFIQQLPDIFASMQIDNYSVMETGSADGKGISPVTKILNELIFSIQNIDFSKLKK